MYEYQPGGNVAVLVSTKLILTTMLLDSYANIPGFLTASVKNAKIYQGDWVGPCHSRCCLPVSFVLAAEKNQSATMLFIKTDNLNCHTLGQFLSHLDILLLICIFRSRSRILKHQSGKKKSDCGLRRMLFKRQVTVYIVSFIHSTDKMIMLSTIWL